MKGTRMILLCLALTLIESVRVDAQGGCQNQICNLEPPSKYCIKDCIQCFNCIYAYGSACNVAPHERCAHSCLSFGCTYGAVAVPSGAAVDAPALQKCAATPLPAPSPGGFQLTIFSGTENDPLLLTEVLHDKDKDLFAKGAIYNAGAQAVVGYKVGWLLYPVKGTKPVEREGALKTLAEPLKPKDHVGIGPQKVIPEESLTGEYARIVFFISEAVTEDGGEWHADLSVIEKKYGQ